MDLALDLLAMDLSNDPDPVRFDGTPPKLEKESVLLASLFDIAGYLVRTVFADTGADDAVFYYINDHLGTPQMIIDETGNIVWRGEYQPFGSVNAAVSDLGNHFRFAGQYYDAETGLHYNYHRYYDPRTGRYLRSDPIGLTGGINLYAYVLNDPINAVDSYGLVRWRAVGKGTVKTIFGAAAVVGGASAAATPTGIGQVLGTAGVLAGSSAIGFGVTQIVAGFTENEIPFVGVKEAVIQETTSGLAQKNLLAASEILDLIPGLASGNPSRLVEALNIIEYGLSIGKSVDEILEEVEEAGLLKPDPCN